MRHHEPLLTMRAQGRKPAGFVHFELDGYAPEWANWREDSPADPRIHIEPADNVRHLDLCFVVGLTVSIDGCDQKRVRDLYESASAQGASRVIASVFRPARDTFQHVEILDTDGVLTWTC